MPEFSVNTSRSSYDVVIENGSLRKLAACLMKKADNTVFAIITDENVASIYQESLSEHLVENGIKQLWIVIKPGEQFKNFESFSFIINELIKTHITRNDYIIAFGGGVIIDIAGYVASTYKRGMKWMVVPTSLLAQADASIGGKTAIHYSGIKNLIGTFHQPSFVLIDPQFNLTLPTRDYNNGLVEILKISLIREDYDFKSWLSGRQEAINKRDLSVLAEIIEQSCIMKAKIVERDEFDMNSRIVLNLGHTLGHALESHGGFGNISHGEAVCAGILFISFIAKRSNDMSPEDFDTITRVFQNYAPGINLENIEWNELLNFIHHDKKIQETNPIWVYPKGFGIVALRQFDPVFLEDSWLHFRDWYSRWCRHEN